ncbi:DUF6247 family protein [Streptomyces lydicus]|uniref:DUF6247 family protein n=1 Tax=Streptomyces lydicus TaxID=47763 RepID=UPI0036EA1DAE
MKNTGARHYRRLRADRRDLSTGFRAGWARALENARHGYSLAPRTDVVHTWQARLAAARLWKPSSPPAVNDAYGIAGTTPSGPRRSDVGDQM